MASSIVFCGHQIGEHYFLASIPQNTILDATTTMSTAVLVNKNELYSGFIVSKNVFSFIVFLVVFILIIIGIGLFVQSSPVTHPDAPKSSSN